MGKIAVVIKGSVAIIYTKFYSMSDCICECVTRMDDVMVVMS
jgi:hypothetical protein